MPTLSRRPSATFSSPRQDAGSRCGTSVLWREEASHSQPQTSHLSGCSENGRIDLQLSQGIFMVLVPAGCALPEGISPRLLMPATFLQCADPQLTVNSPLLKNLTLTSRRTLMRRIRKILLVYLAAAILHPAISAGQTAPDATPLAKQVANLEERLAGDEKTLQDWPNLARYREANARLVPPAAGEQRVVF